MCNLGVPANVLFLQLMFVFVNMASKSQATSTLEQAFKWKRTSLTLKMKLEISQYTDAGEEASTLEHPYNLGKSTIHNIKKNAEKIPSAVVHSTPLPTKVTIRVRNPVMKKVGNMLLLYIKHETEKQLK
ncbi:putative CENPB DNA-binding domain-containing protein 1 [Panulirus ornatus]|uniref:putative CENPB DNA-binding domain-containing protein 1 n=1 Tax=Panulirus ornatus TaxID=150431 RepID=UPI003A88AA5D